MIVTRTSPFTNEVNTRVIDCTPEQMNDYLEGDKTIQIVFPDLSAEDREFIMTGITPKEWDEIFGVESPEDFGEEDV
jgi:hypothetical protein